MPTTHPTSHNADYFFKVALEFTSEILFPTSCVVRMTYATCCQVERSLDNKHARELPQALLLAAYRLGHLLRTAAPNPSRAGAIWTRAQLETDLFSNDCDCDSVMSESFSHLSNSCQFKPRSVLPWRENQRPAPKISEKVVLWSSHDAFHTYPQTALTVKCGLFYSHSENITCLLAELKLCLFSYWWAIGIILWLAGHMMAFSLHPKGKEDIKHCTNGHALHYKTDLWL